jgi:hypothetical protein
MPNAQALSAIYRTVASKPVLQGARDGARIQYRLAEFSSSHGYSAGASHNVVNDGNIPAAAIPSRYHFVPSA